ncbi:Chitin synthase export chaperone [Nosema granulosis]|uniref:Chitin synthase export chaperone n=1 Tax=Nosema granulosis TaxID=83296 RepID=A0A9P6KX80_9MICR|nr:Chitin synthase export chaperone [Nosema granulosis]
MIVVDYICTQIDFPLCRFVSKEACKGMCRSEMIREARINSPTVLILLTVIIGLTTRMIKHVQNLCASIGRAEMSLFFTLYNLSNVLSLVLMSLRHRLNERLMLLCTTAQLVFANSCIFSLLVGAITMDIFVTKFGLESTTILYLSVSIYGFINTIVIFFGLAIKEPISIFVLVFCCNLVFVYAYFILQVKKLNYNKGEIWAYGTLFLALVCFMISSMPIFIGSEMISILTDKYLDNLFFHQLFLFCAVVMIHKFWLSVYDYEVESYLLEL